MKLRVQVLQGDVTTANADVLVNASNTGAWLGSGVSGAIRRACGPGYQEQIQAVLAERFGAPEMEPGQVLLTAAGSHPRARHVAHVAVMDYRTGHEAEAAPDAARIERGCSNLWQALEEIQDPDLTIAMVALGAGTGQLGVRLPTEVACQTLKRHVAGHPTSRVAAVLFYGFQLLEFANIVLVVRKHFPLDETEFPEEARRIIEALDAKGA
jgi:O-acetyl-ADP-ribose deacetylase (regulator of RNase III)